MGIRGKLMEIDSLGFGFVGEMDRVKWTVSCAEINLARRNIEAFRPETNIDRHRDFLRRQAPKHNLENLPAMVFVWCADNAGTLDLKNVSNVCEMHMTLRGYLVNA